MATPRVLFVTCHLPYAGWSGGRRRELELLRRARDRVDLEVCAISKTPDDDLAELDRFREEICPAVVFPAEPPRRAPDVPALVARHRSPRAARWIARRLAGGTVDVVHVEGSYLWHVLPPLGDRPPVLLVEQNVESQLWRQRAALAGDDLDRRRHLDEARRTAAWEVSAWCEADACAAVTDEDAAAIRSTCPDAEVEVIPDGADLVTAAAEPLRRDGSRPVLVYVGNFAYEPNVDAALHLVGDVLPAVRAAGHDPEVWLVGNAPGDDVAALAADPAVTVTGAVPEVGPWLAAADVVVAPLRIGGGVKVKVLEALAAGKAVVTTPVGAQGLAAAVRDGALLVGRDAREVAAHAAGLLADPRRRAGMGRAAVAATKALPTWDDAADRLVAAYRRLATTVPAPRGQRAGA